MTRITTVILLFAFLPIGQVLGDDGSPGDGALLEWTELEPVPGGVGYAGAFAGLVGDRLFVVGGANFPEDPRWQSDKAWHGSIHELSVDNPGSG